MMNKIFSVGFFHKILICQEFKIKQSEKKSKSKSEREKQTMMILKEFTQKLKENSTEEEKVH